MNLEIKSSLLNEGKGLYTTKNIKKGDTVFVLEGEIFSQPTRESIHIGDNKHIYDQYGIFINHSFTPNIHIDGKNVVALQDIESNTELAFNYNDTEINMAAPFTINAIHVCGKKDI